MLLKWLEWKPCIVNIIAVNEDSYLNSLIVPVAGCLLKSAASEFPSALHTFFLVEQDLWYFHGGVDLSDFSVNKVSSFTGVTQFRWTLDSWSWGDGAATSATWLDLSLLEWRNDTAYHDSLWTVQILYLTRIKIRNGWLHYICVIPSLSTMLLQLLWWGGTLEPAMSTRRWQCAQWRDLGTRARARSSAVEQTGTSTAATTTTDTRDRLPAPSDTLIWKQCLLLQSTVKLSLLIFLNMDINITFTLQLITSTEIKFFENHPPLRSIEEHLNVCRLGDKLLARFRFWSLHPTEINSVGSSRHFGSDNIVF